MVISISIIFIVNVLEQKVPELLIIFVFIRAIYPRFRTKYVDSRSKLLDLEKVSEQFTDLWVFFFELLFESRPQEFDND
jgi:hypothetical protein